MIKLLLELQKQLMEKKLTIRLTDGIYEELMLRGYSQEFGARAMERIINEMIIKPLSNAILAKTNSNRERKLTFISRWKSSTGVI